jgi:hypothetical protein
MVTNSSSMMRGIVHGRTIEVEGDLNLPEGQQVTVVVEPVAESPLTPQEAMGRTFGAWAEDAAELDEFLEGVYRDRQQGQPEPGE